MTLTRGFIRNAATTPLDARLMDMATIVCNTDGSPRTGVLGGANGSIVATTGTMNVTVAAAEFVTSKGKADGVAIFTNDGTVNVAIGAAPGSNSRIDVIWVKHEDNTTGDAASAPIFGVTAGTAAASPVKPSIPTGALELATLRIYSGTVATNGGSNVLTNTYQMTCARGGTVFMRSVTERNAWTNPVAGQMVHCYNEDMTFEYVSAGVGWVLVSGKPALTSVTHGTFGGVVYSSGTPTSRVVELGGRISIEGMVTSGSAAFVAGTSYQIGTIPAALAPTSVRRFACVANGVPCELTVFADGGVFIVLYVGYTAALSLTLNGSWTDKRLA